jgi:hypothetical protein
MNFLEKIKYLCKDKETTVATKADDMTDLLLAVLSDYGTACVSLSYYAKKLGYEYPETVDIGGWLKMPILVLKPTLGDIVVFGKDKPTNVGIFISRADGLVYALEVNNGIELKVFPLELILGYRKLHKTDTDEN